jgi:hypothetical protein
MHLLDLRLNQSVLIVLAIQPSNQVATTRYVMEHQQLEVPYLLLMKYLAMHLSLALLATCP